MKTALPKMRFPGSPAPAFSFLKSLLAFFVTSFVSLNFSTSVSAQATITTDKADYFPGETVTISGTHFSSGEIVTLQVLHTGTSGDNGASPAHDPWDVNADANGNVAGTWIVPLDQDEYGATLKLTADGKISALHAEALFTDAQPNLDQAHNGGVGDPPVSPVDWVNGDANATNSHFQEGQSMPYRILLPDLDAGTSHILILEWDIRDNRKSAIDYITSFQRIAETVDPLDGLSGTFDAPNTAAIPAPTSNTLVGGVSQPVTSFNALPASERLMTIYNGTITSITYNAEGDPTALHSASSIKIVFTVSGSSGQKDVVFSWGGHLASRADWGSGNASSDISGSPYHTRFISLDDKGGNQDRSLKLNAVTFVPTCGIKGPNPVCAGTTNQDTAFTNAPGPAFVWEVTGGTVIGSTTDSIIKSTAPSSGSYTAKVTITDTSGGTTSSSTTCSIEVQVSPIPTISIDPKGPLCVNAAAITLTGSPSGGTFSGDGVTGNSFNPATAGLGSHVITYTYSNGTCSNSVSTNIVVGAKATCSITGKANVCINAKNIKYTAPSGLTGYSWSITGNGTINGSSTGSSVLVNAGSVGYYTLTLSVTNGGCTCTCSKKVYVNPNPTCSLSTPYPLPVASSTNNHLCATVSSGITKYTWTVKGTGWSITGGQGTSCVTYTAGAAGSSGTFTLKVTGKAGCTCTCKVTFKASGNTYSQTTSPAVAGDEKADAITVNAYPNPYRNEIKFRFVSPKAGNATLEIYDLVGKKLAIVFNGKVDAGIEQTISYNVPLNGRVPVIYKLTIGDKMLHGMLLPEK